MGVILKKPNKFLAHYNMPLVDGRWLENGSRFTAILMAFANALKMASILWCSLSPLHEIFKLHFAASLNDLKNERTFLLAFLRFSRAEN